MTDKNVNPPSQPKPHTEKDLTKLECPFTWKMGEISKEDNTECNLNDDEELFPLLQLMRHIMTVYMGTKYKIEPDEILEGILVCDDIMLALRQIEYPEISIDAVHYILQSTKCFVYKELNLNKKFKRVYSKMNKDWKMNEKDRSTLMACKSICWSKYHNVGSSEAEDFMRDAIKYNPNCDLWYFIMGKNLRRKRIDTAQATKPGKEELNCFKKAYSMSTSAIFGVFLAQMYREMGKTKDAENIFSKILQQDPTGTTTLLRLAFGFVRLNNYAKAQVCLGKIAKLGCPNHSVYIHYRGIFHFSYKNYQIAQEFLKDASKKNDLPAGKQDLDCAVMLDKSFDVVEYLGDMVQKKNHVPEEQTQSLLDLALSYWLNKRGVPKVLIVYCVADGKSWLFMSEDDYVQQVGGLRAS